MKKLMGSKRMRELRFERVYPHPPEVVWEALSDSRALGEWLMPNNFQPVVGHRFRFRTKPSPGFDGIVDCEVVEVDAPQRLSYTWIGGTMPAPTTVTWTLEPVQGGTRLRLEHSGFSGLGGFIARLFLRGGWGRLLRTGLAAKLAQMAAESENIE